MIPVELPDLPLRAWLGVTIERQDLAGSEAFRVTGHEGVSRPPRQADAAGLPLFDRTLCEEAAG